MLGAQHTVDSDVELSSGVKPGCVGVHTLDFCCQLPQHEKVSILESDRVQIS